MTTITTLSSDSIAQLAMLLTQADEQDRTSSRQIESIADHAATQEENERVAQLRVKADDDEHQALASGIAGIAGGALTVVGAFVPAGGASGVSTTAAPTAAASGASEIAAPTAAACAPRVNWHEILSGAAEVSPNAGGIVAGGYKAGADRADAGAAAAEAHAQADIRRFDQAHGDAQAANESIQKVEQFLDQIQQTQNAARLTAATIRG